MAAMLKAMSPNVSRRKRPLASLLISIFTPTSLITTSTLPPPNAANTTANAAAIPPTKRGLTNFTFKKFVFSLFSWMYYL